MDPGMNFREWIEEAAADNTIFCDLDDTLVKSKHISSMSIYDLVPRNLSFRDRMEKGRAMQDSGYDVLQGHIEQGWIPFESHGERYIAQPKPNAHKFVEELRKMGQVFVYTQGKKEHQLKVIQACELPFAPNQVFGREDYGHMPHSPNAVLIDDLGVNTQGVTEKLRSLGLSEDRFVQFQQGQDLLQLLPAVRALLK